MKSTAILGLTTVALLIGPRISQAEPPGDLLDKINKHHAPGEFETCLELIRSAYKLDPQGKNPTSAISTQWLESLLFI